MKTAFEAEGQMYDDLARQLAVIAGGRDSIGLWTPRTFDYLVMMLTLFDGTVPSSGLFWCQICR